MTVRLLRLEALLGAPLDAVPYTLMAGPVGNPAAYEAEDLDYKGEHYTTDNKGRSELAKDVAAFANSAGGLLIIGMAEDRARRVPSKVMPVELTDGRLVSAGTAAAAGGYPTQKQIDKYVLRGGPYVADCDWNRMILVDWGHNPYPRRSQLRISLDRCSRELNEVNGWHARALERVGRLRGVLEAARRQHGRSSTEAKEAEKELDAAIRAAQALDKDIEDLQKEIGRIEDRLGDL